MRRAYTLIEVKPRIFFLNFKDHYDMSSHFMRYQEYYESPSAKFRNQPFSWPDFMEYYAKKFGNGAFSYHVDWAGFNIPGTIIKHVHMLGIPDPNKYDAEMLAVYEKCLAKYPDRLFYIIGAVGEKWAMKHEIAHGFFYTQDEYRKEMTALVKALPKTLRTRINKVLKDIGYTPGVYIDETQAYMSTGVPEKFKIKTGKQTKPFEELYNKYYTL